MLIYADAKYTDVPLETKQELFDEVKADMRYDHQLYGCYECGICVAACPSARFYDFSPRVFAQVMAREDVDTFYELLNDSVWDCSQCFSCTRCPRQNNPGGIITIMREVAVNHGMQSAKDALKAYSRIIYKIMSTGTQVAPSSCLTCLIGSCCVDAHDTKNASPNTNDSSFVGHGRGSGRHNGQWGW